jgi:type II secretory pathway pseudopilin PulG
LIELMVAIGLFAFVMLFVTATLFSTSRVTKAQTSRSVRQATLQSTMRHVENVLRKAPVVGVRWLRSAPNGALLAAQGIQDGPLSSTLSPLSQPHWKCVLWDEQARTLTMGESQVAGGYPAPATSHYQPMPDAQMQAIIDGETPLVGTLLRGRRIADRVTDFVFEVAPGPLYQIELELDVPPGDNADLPDVKERQRASLRLYPRQKA